MKCVHVFVSGNVQGVYFRSSTKEVADVHSVRGWVRNTEDGRVEAVLEGDDKSVDEVVKFMRAGPPTSMVEGLEAKEKEPEGFEDFQVRR